MLVTPPSAIVSQQRRRVEPRAVAGVGAEVRVHVDESRSERHDRQHVRAPGALERGGGIGEDGHGAGC